MKSSAFEKLIRNVVREEIDHALRREIALLKEELTPSLPQQRVVENKSEPNVEEFRSKLRSQMPPPNFNTGDATLNGLLQETATSPTWEERVASNDPVSEFANKDYSQVMKAIENKKGFRPGM